MAQPARQALFKFALAAIGGMAQSPGLQLRQYPLCRLKSMLPQTRHRRRLVQLGQSLQPRLAGAPLDGDFTAALSLWDAGSEVNMHPGAGVDQAPFQSGPDTGADEGGVVRIVNDGFAYPETSAVVRLTITPAG